MERLAPYLARCPFSLERIVSVNDQGKVVYRAEKAAVHRYPLFGDAKLSPGVLRNFEVFDPLDFIAELTQHPSTSSGLESIPDGGMQLVRYMGWYSNRVRGTRAKKARARNIREECVKGESLEGDEDDESMRQGPNSSSSTLISISNLLSVTRTPGNRNIERQLSLTSQSPQS